MKNKGVVLLMVVVIALGIFALPNTICLFSGQHSWYDLSAAPNEVPCEKCHAEIEDEMQSDENGAHRNLTCAMCHRTCFNNYTYGSGYGSDSTAGKEVHAASAVKCMDCHGILHDYGKWNHYSYPEYGPEFDKCVGCHWGGGYPDFISAGGFGRNTTIWDTGEKAAHKKFVLDAIDDPLMEGANEACIACHTRIGVNITWTKKEYLKFTVYEDEAGDWTIPDFTAGGENVTQVNTSNSWTNP